MRGPECKVMGTANNLEEFRLLTFDLVTTEAVEKMYPSPSVTGRTERLVKPIDER